MKIRNIEKSDRQQWNPLWQAYLVFYETSLPDQTTDLTWDRFFDSSHVFTGFVAEEDGKLLGGGGIYPTEGLPAKTCELVKMYLHKDARGKGLGKQMIEQCLTWAKDNGYEQVYLESMPELSKAVSIYEKVGFEKLNQALGNSGHCGCDIWMLKKL